MPRYRDVGIETRTVLAGDLGDLGGPGVGHTGQNHGDSQCHMSRTLHADNIQRLLKALSEISGTAGKSESFAPWHSAVKVHILCDNTRSSTKSSEDTTKAELYRQKLGCVEGQDENVLVLWSTFHVTGHVSFYDTLGCTGTGHRNHEHKLTANRASKCAAAARVPRISCNGVHVLIPVSHWHQQRRRPLFHRCDGQLWRLDGDSSAYCEASAHRCGHTHPATCTVAPMPPKLPSPGGKRASNKLDKHCPS